MTIQEAIQSGKPFRREEWRWPGPPTWWEINEDMGIAVRDVLTGNLLMLRLADILATDWETKP